MANKDILVKNVDVDLLENQLDSLLETFERGTNENIDGLINMIEEMLEVV